MIIQLRWFRSICLTVSFALGALAVTSSSKRSGVTIKHGTRHVWVACEARCVASAERRAGHSSNGVSDIMKYLWMKWEGAARFTLCRDTGCSINWAKLITEDKFWIRSCQRGTEKRVTEVPHERYFAVGRSHFSAEAHKTRTCECRLVYLW